jgi:hypothetical protein
VDNATAGKSGIPTSVVSTIKVPAPPAKAKNSLTGVTTGGGIILLQSLHKQISVPLVKMKKVAMIPRNISPPIIDFCDEIVDSTDVTLGNSSNFSVGLAFLMKELVISGEGTIGEDSVFSGDDCIITISIRCRSRLERKDNLLKKVQYL